MDAEPGWGVTALQAGTQMDAGPIWASADFPLAGEPPTRSTVSTGPVADVAMQLLDRLVAAAGDPAFAPEPLDYRKPDVRGRLRPPARQADRTFSWSDPADHVLRRIRAADGAPGVHTVLCGEPVAVFDAHHGTVPAGDQGRPAGWCSVRASSSTRTTPRWACTDRRSGPTCCPAAWASTRRAH